MTIPDTVAPPVSADSVAALRAALVAQGVWRTPGSGDGAESAWYVTLLQAGAAWLAALLLLPFLGWLILGAGDFRSVVPVGAVVVGAIAGLLGWLGRGHVFLAQLGAALGLAAGIMAVAWAFNHAFGWVLPAVLGLGLYAAGPNFSNRLLNGFTLCAAVYLGTAHGDAFEALLAGNLGSAAILGWVALAAWTASAAPAWRHAESVAPLAWASVICAGIITAVGAQPASWLGSAALAPAYWQPSRVACALLPLAAWLIAGFQRQDSRPARSTLIGVAVVLLALVPFGQAAPGVALALAWLIVGFAQSRVVLLAAAGLGVLGYLGRYYYQLDVSLLHKAGWLASAAFVLGVTAAAVGMRLQRIAATAATPTPAPSAAPGGDASGLPVDPREVTSPSLGRPALRRSRAGLALGLVLALAIGNLTVARYDRVVREGQTLVLALAPVDPRSLMQGDYMTLRFAAAAQIDEAVRYVAGEGDDREKRPAYAVFRTTEPQAPAQWVGLLDTLGPLQPGEVAVRLTPTPRGVRFATDAYFFEEGQASRYEAARFGELRVDANGTAILVGLRDGEGRPL